jgi:DNA-binding MarR family transcriptional regulator
MLPIYRMPGHLIRRLHQMSVAVFAEKIAAAGADITPVQYGALCAVRAYPGLDQATVASMIAYDRVTIGGVLDRLEQ